MSDFRLELVAAAKSGEVEWSEWSWLGTRDDGTALKMAGVIIRDVRNARLAWTWLYVEPVEEGGAGIDATVCDMTASGCRRAAQHVLADRFSAFARLD